MPTYCVQDYIDLSFSFRLVRILFLIKVFLFLLTFADIALTYSRYCRVFYCKKSIVFQYLKSQNPQLKLNELNTAYKNILINIFKLYII